MRSYQVRNYVKKTLLRSDPPKYLARKAYASGSGGFRKFFDLEFNPGIIGDTSETKGAHCIHHGVIGLTLGFFCKYTAFMFREIKGYASVKSNQPISTAAYAIGNIFDWSKKG